MIRHVDVFIWYADKHVFNFRYVQLHRVFGKVTHQLGIRLVPYQARHSGASTDYNTKFRDLAAIKKRGGWKSDRSVQRYEKHARMAQAWERRTLTFKSHAEIEL